MGVDLALKANDQRYLYSHGDACSLRNWVTRMQEVGRSMAMDDGLTLIIFSSTNAKLGKLVQCL